MDSRGIVTAIRRDPADAGNPELVNLPAGRCEWWTIPESDWCSRNANAVHYHYANGPTLASNYTFLPLIQPRRELKICQKPDGAT